MKDVEFKIDLVDKTPVSHRYRQIHPKYQERVQEKLKLYKFNRMPFGYTGSGGFFRRSVENVLAGILYSQSLLYLDDVLVLGKSFADHCASLDMVLSRLYNSGISLKLKKCKFFTNETNYLGHMISDNGIKHNLPKNACYGAIEETNKYQIYPSIPWLDFLLPEVHSKLRNVCSFSNRSHKG